MDAASRRAARWKYVARGSVLSCGDEKKRKKQQWRSAKKAVARIYM